MEGIEAIFTLQGLVSLFTLSILEIVLGIDNIIFISIICDRLPKKLQDKARTLGIGLALIVRIGLLAGIKFIIGMVEPIFSIPFLEHLGVEDTAFSGRDLILLSGGLFLIYKTIKEIHEKVAGHEAESDVKAKSDSIFGAIIQIVLIDIIFSFDSILTAVGLSDNLPIMILAVIIAVGTMMVFAKNVSDYINDRPTIKMLALSFLVMIGFLLVMEGFGEEVPKGYVYFAMAFAFVVEMLNLRSSRSSEEES